MDLEAENCLILDVLSREQAALWCHLRWQRRLDTEVCPCDRVWRTMGMLRAMGAGEACIHYYWERRAKGSGFRHIEDGRDVHAVRLAERACEVYPDTGNNVGNANDATYVRAARFLHEWQVAAWVLQQNAKGLVVPSGLILHRYVMSWGIGPHCASLTHHLWRLRDHVVTRKNWMRAFRLEWGFRWGTMKPRPELDPIALESKAATTVM